MLSPCWGMLAWALRGGKGTSGHVEEGLERGLGTRDTDMGKDAWWVLGKDAQQVREPTWEDTGHIVPCPVAAPYVKELKNELEDVEEVLAGTADPLQCNSLTQVGRKLHA